MRYHQSEVLLIILVTTAVVKFDNIYVTVILLAVLWLGMGWLARHRARRRRIARSQADTRHQQKLSR